ncbi:hypothetical protein L208DRAFT_1551156 [Tricholoma matsutake]|nr:hypothetical protein L208DRAFT_1551156 [Tricholoma matsutake 945]
MIRKWEYQMIQWMQAYRTGLGPKAAQFEVKKFSSTKYKSHRCPPEQLVCFFDMPAKRLHRHTSYLSYLILYYIIAPIVVTKKK